MKTNLSAREEQIVELAAWGAQKKEIAHKLFISLDTVVTHMKTAYKKIGVSSINQLSAWWFCTKFKIPKNLNPLLTAFLFLVLTGVNVSIDGNKTTKVKTKVTNSYKVKRKSDSK